ncbi:hypothetical protein FKW77_008923 [Venturia effusa]|uniref:Pal1 cell morphology protein n=1 Tax=Venturia effusa TaxID=50376 RepID=A0A517LEL2_9PEZI|nr:hypothetical protein FKW77_008923 [Venturia effusa]
MASLLEPGQQPEQHASPALSLNLNSNNPFRNPRLGSALPSPALPTPQIGRSANGTPVNTTLKPVNTNPFLASFEHSDAPKPSNPPPQIMSTSPSTTAAPSVPIDSDAAQLFHRLTLVDTGDSARPLGAQQQQQPRSATHPNPAHRPSRSDLDQERRTGPRRGPQVRRPGPSEELDIFASPDRKPSTSTRNRRNSESSVLEKSSLTEEERRRRERRHRERDARSREKGGSPGKARDSSRASRDGKATKSSSTRIKKPRGMDLIDQLDQTGIYGAGLFHHDGPFDAANPHRNRKRDNRAPMRAFPATSANMMLGGSGPLNKGIDLERFHGVGVEGFQDYGKAGNDFPRRADGPGRTVTAAHFDPVSRVEPIHAEETMGLGTSTFLEGAPASKKAVMRRRESETQMPEPGLAPGGSLGRKKSLAQRFRGGIRGDRPARSPELPRYNNGINDTPMPDSPPKPIRAPPIPSREAREVQSAGGPSRIHQGESNPFDTMYDEAYDKKGASISIAEKERGGRARAPSTPMRPLERRITTDNADGDPENKPTGFLSRVKSLKGGRRVRRPS